MSDGVEIEDDVDSDVDDTDVITDVEEVMSRGLTITTTNTTDDEEEDEEDEDEEEKAASSSSFRNKMMLQQKSSSNTASRSLCIRIADLSHTLRQSVHELQLDVDGDGQLDTDEILSAVQHLTTQTKTQASLRKMVGALCTFVLLLVVCVFASTLTAARLVQDTTLDPLSGMMYAKGGNAQHKIMMKTEAVAIYRTATTTTSTVATMTNTELEKLQAILPGGTGGGVKFQVKGYARKQMAESSDSDSEEEELVQLLVEGGGTITYDKKGITAATGTAKVLLTFAAYGDGDGDVVFDSSSSSSNTHYLYYGPHDVYVSGG